VALVSLESMHPVGSTVNTRKQKSTTLHQMALIVFTQKQPDCKKGTALFKLASVKKLQINGAANKWL